MVSMTLVGKFSTDFSSVFGCSGIVPLVPSDTRRFRWSLFLLPFNISHPVIPVLQYPVPHQPLPTDDL